MSGRTHNISRLLAAVALVSHGWTSAEPTSGQELVFFPFDDYSLPFNKGLLLNLVPGSKAAKDYGLKLFLPAAVKMRDDHGLGVGARDHEVDLKHPDGPVLLPGRPGDPDYPRVYYYGSVVRVGDQFRMWYTGWDVEMRRQVCYAVSSDGVNWTKPKLGLVEYRGSRNNNLVVLDDSGPILAASCWILYEPDDPDSSRRFKMIREPLPDDISAAYSPDGLHWKNSPANPIIRESGMEPGGLIKFNGCYYLNGHGGPIPDAIPGARKRMMVTYASYDFDHWTTAAHLSFRRDNVPPRTVPDFELHRGEQVHIGASLWNRGNVVIGFYGQFHNSTNDRRTSAVDLGMVVSPDAIHFSEPVPDFKMIPSIEESDDAEPRLTQGEGFENVGDRTFFWYGIWIAANPNGPTGVRLATWPRDRLGFFSPPPRMPDAHCLSRPLRLDRPARIYLNAGGLSEAGHLKVEILDEHFLPVPGYSGADAIPVVASGFRQPVRWRGTGVVEEIGHPIRLRIVWEGADADLVRLYAVYVD